VETITHLIAQHGYWVVASIVCLESMGVPLPGETTLVSAAVYAGTTHELNIWMLMFAAAIGAIAGDNLGFWIGREYGYRLLLRYGSVIRLNQRRVKLGQFLFDRHGGAVVFFGRFVAILRVLAALLAGLNCMTWGRFLLFNALGAIVWAGAYGLGAYVFGHTLANALSSIGLVLGLVAAAAAVAVLLVARRFERRMADAAERALPGPLLGPGGCAALSVAAGDAFEREPARRRSGADGQRRDHHAGRDERKHAGVAKPR